MNQNISTKITNWMVFCLKLRDTLVTLVYNNFYITETLYPISRVSKERDFTHVRAFFVKRNTASTYSVIVPMPVDLYFATYVIESFSEKTGHNAYA